MALAVGALSYRVPRPTEKPASDDPVGAEEPHGGSAWWTGLSHQHFLARSASRFAKPIRLDLATPENNAINLRIVGQAVRRHSARRQSRVQTEDNMATIDPRKRSPGGPHFSPATVVAVFVALVIGGPLQEARWRGAFSSFAPSPLESASQQLKLAEIAFANGNDALALNWFDHLAAKATLPLNTGLHT